MIQALHEANSLSVKTTDRWIVECETQVWYQIAFFLKFLDAGIQDISTRILVLLSNDMNVMKEYEVT